MKRAVFISVLSLLSLQSPGNLTPEYTYLKSIASCDALCISPKVISNIKLYTPGRFKYKNQYVISPLNSKHQNLPVASVNASVILLPEEPDLKLTSLSFLRNRKKDGKYKSFLLNRFKNDIKVPP